MRLYELQKPGFEDELDQQLKSTANRIDQNQNRPEPPMGTPDQGASPESGDPSAQQEMPAGAQPGPAEDAPEYETKPADTALFAAVKSLPYASKYEFDDDSKIHPLNIMVLGLDELNNLLNLVKTKMNLKNLTDEFGMYDDPATKFYRDMLNFVERVLSYRKQHDESDSPARMAPPVERQATPRSQAGEWKRKAA